MINFTLYTADCTGNSSNCLYPHKMKVTGKDTFIAAIKTDHVTAKYKGNYRSNDNFEYSDCVPLDCDNDHSENPDDWITPFDLAMAMPGVQFAASYSRHHMKVKGDKSVRPRFHVFFAITVIKDAEEYADLKRELHRHFPTLIPMHLIVRDFFMELMIPMLKSMTVINQSWIFLKRMALQILMPALNRCRKDSVTAP